jgi:CRP/FNR family transcriptional regulator
MGEQWNSRLNEQWNAHSTDFIASLSEPEKQQLFAVGVKRTFRKDDMVFNVGASSEDIYILIDGRIKIYELSQEGKEVILWFCFPGELFGLGEVMCRRNQDKREVNAQACSYTEVLVVKYADFVQYLMTMPATAMRVIDLLCYRLRELGDVLLNLASEDVTSRVIKLITRLSARYGKRMGDSIYLDIPLTHQEMADMIGTSRQTVTTVLGALKRKGILRVEHRTIFIQNFEWIENITGRTPASQASLSVFKEFRI